MLFQGSGLNVKSGEHHEGFFLPLLLDFSLHPKNGAQTSAHTHTLFHWFARAPVHIVPRAARATQPT